jgi:NTE family protein
MRRAARTVPRRALVLGGGGVLGFAWTLGALTALESEAGFDARDMDVAIGTSAGSVTAALLGCGLAVEVISRHHQGIPAPHDPIFAFDYTSATGEALPPRPGWRPASPRLAMDGLRHPRRIPGMVALTGLLPAGRASLQPVHDLVAGVAATAGLSSAWPSRPRPWIVAVDYTTGRRIAFGRDDLAVAPDGRRRIVRQATLADAVQASCSIPGWYPPVEIDGVPYIDGGAVSNASVDMLSHTTVDEAYILAPMASLDPDRPRTAMGRLERRIRRSVTKRIVADVAALRAAGVRVCLVTPGAPDLETMGANLMNPARRSDVLDSARTSATAQIRAQLASSARWPRHREARGAAGGTGSPA